MSSELLLLVVCFIPLLCIVLMICWGLISDTRGSRALAGERLTLARLVNERDTASSMRFGFLLTITSLCLAALIGVCLEFDCTAFWSCLGGTFAAAFAAKGWQREIELSKEGAAS